MHVLITGGTGFIGEALIPALTEGGHTVSVLTRQALASAGAVAYLNSLEAISDSQPVEAVINLAGASMAGKRWSEAYKRELVSSRLDTTVQLVDWMAKRQTPPEVLLSASAIGYYGHHGDEPLDEQGPATPGFAQDLCARWEAAAARATEQGTRVCLMRLGVVLDSGGGAYQQMALPFRLGVGNWIGSGRQWLSWIHRQDVVSAILLLLE